MYKFIITNTAQQNCSGPFSFYDHLPLPFSLIAISKLLSNLQSFPHGSPLSADNFYCTKIKSHQMGTPQFPAIKLLVFPPLNPLPSYHNRGTVQPPPSLNPVSHLFQQIYTIGCPFSQKSPIKTTLSTNPHSSPATNPSPLTEFLKYCAAIPLSLFPHFPLFLPPASIHQNCSC